ncbi:multidrug ABC transporter ATP-binding protein [Actinophytocola xinjiangensis]|uniref:Multidrug ABC transporter ATP-binding protein n=1 Tax=Actinophytocola xinjiangensis TaxID=485602 RepID=A0A7Z0WMA0_9PSEU|nr:ABC transporter ATP-binding protein [Actinophytocola xinjiangensis]OLF10106.1 multidrug ABC transporter ATP-binding protein [Actinophytocola xinjiangensis]
MAIIEVDGLVKRYGERTAVDGVSFTVDAGEIFGILGPNGAGKTTTVECVEGLRTADAGTIRVCGLDPGDVALRHRLGAQLQESQLQDKLTVREAMELYSSFYRHPADWRELLDLLGLRDKIDSQFRRLSGGQKQRLSIALALVGNPEVAVLDELTTGLDPQARRDVWDLIDGIRERGVTIVLVTHFMEEAERLCDRLALIDAGKIVALDSPAGLVATVDGVQRIRFRPSAPLDHALLSALPEVTDVARSGRQLVITGHGNVLHAVTSVLARNQIIAADLRVEQTTLDDAFVALTGRNLETQETP